MHLHIQRVCQKWYIIISFAFIETICGPDPGLQAACADMPRSRNDYSQNPANLATYSATQHATGSTIKAACPYVFTYAFFEDGTSTSCGGSGLVFATCVNAKWLNVYNGKSVKSFECRTS